MGKEYNSRREFEAYIQERAVKDEEFRKELLADTKAVIQRELNARVEEGVQIPDNITMEVIEEKPDTLYLVIPPSPAQIKDELSDEELEAVAGGAISLVVGVVVAVGAATAVAGVTIAAAVTDVETAVNVHHKVNVK